MSTRKIIFSRIAIDANIGILPHEQQAPQPIHIDAQLDVDITQTVNDRSIASVLDYRDVHDLIVSECTSRHINLLETLTDRLAQALLEAFAQVRCATVRVTKLSAFPNTAGVAIEVTVRRSDC